MSISISFNTFKKGSTTQINRQNPNFMLNNIFTNIREYAITSFSGVNTFYVIDSFKNMFRIDEGSGNLDITIPTGNYTYTTFLIELQLQLNAVGSDTYTLTHDNLLNKYIISSTGTFKIVPIANDCYYESGFTDSTANDIIESSKTANETWQLAGIKTILISSSNFGQCRINTSSSINVIAEIPVVQTYLGVIHYSHNLNFIKTQIPELSSVDFLILDSRYRKFEVNSDWSITILLNK